MVPIALTLTVIRVCTPARRCLNIVGAGERETRGLAGR